MTNEDLYVGAQILPEFGPPLQIYNSGSTLHGCAGYEIGVQGFVSESQPLSLYLSNKWVYNQPAHDIWKENLDHPPIAWSHGTWSHRFYCNAYAGGHGWSWKVTGPNVTNGEIIAHGDGYGRAWQSALFSNMTLYPQENRGFVNPTPAGSGGSYRPDRGGWGELPLRTLAASPRWAINSYCHAISVTQPEQDKVDVEITNVPVDWFSTQAIRLADFVAALELVNHRGRSEINGTDFNHHDMSASMLYEQNLRFNTPVPGIITGYNQWVDRDRKWEGGYLDVGSGVGSDLIPFWDDVYFFDAADGANTFTDLTDTTIWNGGSSGPGFPILVITPNPPFASIFVLVSNWDDVVAPVGAQFLVTTSGITGPTNCNGSNLQAVVVAPLGDDYIIAVVVPEPTIAGSYSGGTMTVDDVKLWEEAKWFTGCDISTETIQHTVYAPASSTSLGNVFITTASLLQTDSQHRFGVILHRNGTNLKNDDNYSCLGSNNNFALGICANLYGPRAGATDLFRYIRFYNRTRIPAGELDWAATNRTNEWATLKVRHQLPQAATRAFPGSASPMGKSSNEYTIAYMCAGSLLEVQNHMRYLSDNGYLSQLPHEIPR